MKNIKTSTQYNISKIRTMKWSRTPIKWESDERKDTIAHNVICFSFLIGILLSIPTILNCWYFKNEENKVPDLTGDLMDIWNIVIPIITFALGHVFGKHSE